MSLFLFLILICVLVAIFYFVSNVQKGKAQFGVFANYKSHLIKKIFQLDLHWRADKNSGDIIDKTNTASIGIKDSIDAFSEIFLFNLSTKIFLVIYRFGLLTTPLVGLNFVARVLLL